MDLICASCRRCLTSHCGHRVFQHGSQVLVWRHVLPFQLTPLLLYGRPAAEEMAEVINSRKESTCPPLVPAVQIADDEAIRERFQSTPEFREREEWKEQRLQLLKLPSIYLKLSKSRLTALVVLTALSGYTMAPASVQMGTLLWATTGTWLCSAAANSFNQWIEVPYDSQMARTRNRVLVRGLISPLHAVLFGLTTGITGVTLLWLMVNPLTATLGTLNLLLYTAAYTPLKRVSILNTWVGAVVGAIPPLMGWAACTGTLDKGALALAGILYAWQFAHFNALSWSLRGDYSRAGYRMMSVTNPALCKRVALRYSIIMAPICTLAPMYDVTTWWFVLDTLPVNGWLTYLAWRFYRDSDFRSARKLFHFSLFHLPLLMALMLLNKKSWNSGNKDQKQLGPE